MVANDLTAEQLKAFAKVPECVELEQLDAKETFQHVIFRVEHVVEIFRVDGDDVYSRREANACRRWLKKFASCSEYASG